MATTHRSRFHHFHAVRPVALALLAAGLATPVAALDYVWFGGSGNWDNGANWSLLGVPGAGDLATINAGTATLSFDRLVGELRMTAGTLTGAGLTISGTATLIGGTQTGTGTSQFNGNVLISGNASRTLSGGRIMVTAGTTTWGGNTSDGGNDLNFSGSASIVNTGTWNDTNSFASAIASGSSGTKVFTNAGTYNKTGAGTSTVFAGFVNTGHLRVQAGAVFAVANTNFSNSGTINGNGTLRTATNDNLDNHGVIAPGNSVGTLTLDGDLTMGAAGQLQFELTSTADFDRLLITDDVSFTGTLAVLNLGYAPVVGDRFKIISFDQRLAGSEFANLTWSGFAPGVGFTATYNPHDVTLNVTAVPEPGAWALMLAGMALIGGMARRRAQA